MKFDRNTLLGFVILALLFFGYFWYNNQEIVAARKIEAQKIAVQKRISDSLARLDKPKQDSLNRVQDSLNKVITAGSFGIPTDTARKVYTLENDLLIAHFDNKGGQLHTVELKKFRGPDSNLVRMGGSAYDDISYTINTGTNRTAQTSDLVFNKVDSSVLSDGSKKIVFSLSDSSGQGIQHEYVIHPGNYMIDMNIRVANSLVTGGVMNLTWKYVAEKQEGQVDYEKQNTQIGYVEDGSFDYHTIGKRSSKDFSESLKWVGIRQRFFMGALVAKNNFNANSKIEWTDDSTDNIVQSVASLKLSVPANTNTAIPLSIYYGPSDYHILKKYDLKFEQLVNLGQGVYAFVRPLNKYVILPIFDFFTGIAGSMGLAIVLLTLVIRLLISPLNYSSYLSGAKMKALRPELNALKEKVGDDRQAMSMEQMKLYREAGVNPLGGCIPALLQIPIFFALFSFFNSAVDLRGEHFLWATDLSAPDTLIHWGMNIPLLGNHLSLFNVTASLTSFLISFYSMSMTPDQSNPVMKYMPYIFPFFLLLFFNNLPAGLTWYYTVSNVITLLIQVVIQTYIIDHDKIIQKIEANRKKPKVKSKWQERMEQVQQVQEQQKQLKDKQRKK